MRISEIFFESSQPTVAYHITTEENAEEIMHSGLRPSGNDRAVYLLIDTRDIPEVRGWIESKTDDIEQLTLLQVNIDGIRLVHKHGWYRATETIPPNRIKDLGWQALQKY